ncbi:sigma-54-dependent Fis family transcriptional regulator [Pseudonocardia sp. ICBG601]|uniref:sigma-54-dependent Fis family transcriptional regulator n=1 Tax=Pseudonocardia sp. ICBG601 TaxID=2846759 RepID=UPI001CF6FEA7|nr:helix-turn-helix domain-containing protein [Pseudonocardia sp. ICBG601]
MREDAVRPPILASWIRSRDSDVAPDSIDLPEIGRETDSPLVRAATPIVSELCDQFATEPVSLILCDGDGVVLDRRTGDSALRQHLDRVWLVPGFSYAEQHVGTNGIGTALEGRRPTEVFGHEHFVEHLEDLACAGAPIRHPVTGKILGVVDLTCWRSEANALMVATAATTARRIEEALLAASGRHELTLLHDYLTAVQRGGDSAVLAVGDDLVMMNDRARELIAPGDQVPLLAGATDALRAGRNRQLVVDLPSGATARVQCRPSWNEAGSAGGILQVSLTHRETVGRGSATPTITTALPTAVGSGALWTKCAQAVDRHFRTNEWLVLQGEPAPAGPRWPAPPTTSTPPPGTSACSTTGRRGPALVLRGVRRARRGGGTLVLREVDRLPPAAAAALADVLEPHRESTDPERAWVVATRGSSRTTDSPELASLLDCFPRTIEVPPLRHHVEDVAELVPYLLARLTRGADLTCAPEALRVLMRHRWPGNVEQLYQVLRKVVSRRRTGVIRLEDLPPETRVLARRVLTPLESIECDAIVDALLDADGNKAEAARRLGMSRATIYRKIRGYGIATPEGAGMAR